MALCSREKEAEDAGHKRDRLTARRKSRQNKRGRGRLATANKGSGSDRAVQHPTQSDRGNENNCMLIHVTYAPVTMYRKIQDTEGPIKFHCFSNDYQITGSYIK